MEIDFKNAHHQLRQTSWSKPCVHPSCGTMLYQPGPNHPGSTRASHHHEWGAYFLHPVERSYSGRSSTPNSDQSLFRAHNRGEMLRLRRVGITTLLEKFSRRELYFQESDVLVEVSARRCSWFDSGNRRSRLIGTFIYV